MCSWGSSKLERPVWFPRILSFFSFPFFSSNFCPRLPSPVQVSDSDFSPVFYYHSSQVRSEAGVTPRSQFRRTFPRVPFLEAFSRDKKELKIYKSKRYRYPLRFLRSTYGLCTIARHHRIRRAAFRGRARPCRVHPYVGKFHQLLCYEGLPVRLRGGW